MRRFLFLAVMMAVTVSMFGVSGVFHAPAALAADNTKISDPATKFCRIYAVGDGDDAADELVRKTKMETLKAVLDGKQHAGSPAAQVLLQKTKEEVLAAIGTAITQAVAGNCAEITFYFAGHGGNEMFGAGGEAGEGTHDEHIRTAANERITDDELATAFATKPANTTLILLLDSCYAGGFTGGANDIAETDNIKVIGPSGTCPLGGDTISKAVGDAVAADGDGVVSGNEAKAAVTAAGFTTSTEECEGSCPVSSSVGGTVELINDRANPAALAAEGPGRSVGAYASMAGGVSAIVIFALGGLYARRRFSRN